MEEKTLEKAEKIIKGRDERKFKKRVQRLIDVGTITYSSEEISPPHYLWSYIGEAGESYLEGNFRSCIFCCAATAEQIIKHELIRSSKDFSTEMHRIKKMTLGGLITEIKNHRALPQFKKLLDHFNWLNRARITIAVHPLYVGVYEKNDTPEMKIWKNKTMIENIRENLPLLDEADRERVLDSELRMIPEEKSYKLRELLSDPQSDHIFVVWRLIEDDVFQRLALKAHKKMKEIIEEVYPIRQYNRQISFP